MRKLEGTLVLTNTIFRGDNLSIMREMPELTTVSRKVTV